MFIYIYNFISIWNYISKPLLGIYNLKSQGFLNIVNHRKFFCYPALSILQYCFPWNTSLTNESVRTR